MAGNQALLNPASGIVCEIVERHIARPRYLQKMTPGWTRHVNFLEMMFVFLDRNPASPGWLAQVCLPTLAVVTGGDGSFCPQGMNLSVTDRRFLL